MRISDWSSDVCSSDLSYESAERERDAIDRALRSGLDGLIAAPVQERSTAWTPIIKAGIPLVLVSRELPELNVDFYSTDNEAGIQLTTDAVLARGAKDVVLLDEDMPFSTRSEEHTSELQSLMRISYAVFCLKKKKIQ